MTADEEGAGQEALFSQSRDSARLPRLVGAVRAGVRGTAKEHAWEGSLGVSHGLRVSACGSLWESQGGEGLWQ